MPKHTRHTVERCLDVAAEYTIRNMLTANGPPKESGRFVTRINIGPRFLRVNSFAASEAEVLMALSVSVASSEKGYQIE